ncbi:MAG: hypothetical protein QNJ60_11085 [Xenococcaceae cyanobacterium MO_188.B19]|nr:hypothetical protein [Xenococcaceae cyanobacterium MO_188.B19]
MPASVIARLQRVKEWERGAIANNSNIDYFCRDVASSVSTVC